MTDTARVANSAPKIDAAPLTVRRAPVPLQIGNVGGLVGAIAAAATVLPSGHSHLTIPDWTPLAGPMVVPLTGNAVLSTISGMGEAATIVEVPPLVGMIIVLIATTVHAVATSANDAGSPVGTRFASSSVLAPGVGTAFVSAIDHDGHKKWFPVTAGAV